MSYALMVELNQVTSFEIDELDISIKRLKSIEVVGYRKGPDDYGINIVGENPSEILQKTKTILSVALQIIDARRIKIESRKVEQTVRQPPGAVWPV